MKSSHLSHQLATPNTPPPCPGHQVESSRGVVADMAKPSGAREEHYTRELATDHQAYLSGRGESQAGGTTPAGAASGPWTLTRLSAPWGSAQCDGQHDGK